MEKFIIHQLGIFSFLSIWECLAHLQNVPSAALNKLEGNHFFATFSSLISLEKWGYTVVQPISKNMFSKHVQHYNVNTGI